MLNWATHEYLHRTRGAVIAEGFSISAYTTSGDGSADAIAQVELGNGTFFDEDLEVANFGDGDDLKIFHNNAASLIQDTGTGPLYIEGMVRSQTMPNMGRNNTYGRKDKIIRRSNTMHRT